MKEQNYSNHVRYYYPHHFIFYPVVLTAAGVCFYFSATRDDALLWLCMGGVLMLIAALSFMMRQHYALMNQNRIVRLELRFRYYILTQKRLEPLEQKLSFGQLAALRFADDEQFLILLDRSQNENLSPDAIKKNIIHWQPDRMRV